MLTKMKFAKGTIYIRGTIKIYYGDKEGVEKKINNDKTKFSSIYYYETRDELEKNLTIDKTYYKDDMDGVTFVNVDGEQATELLSKTS